MTPHTLIELLERASQAPYGLHFIDDPDEAHLSYRELHQRLPHLCAALQALTATSTGEPLLLVMPNGSALVSTFFAAIHGGMIPTILPALQPFGSRRTWAQKIAQVAERCGGASVVLNRALRGALVEALGEDRAPRSAAIEDVMAIEGAAGLATSPPIAPQNTAFLQFTSGSLNEPKGVMLSHRAATVNAIEVAARMGLTTDDVFLYWVPLAHDMAVIALLAGMAMGVEQHILTTASFAADPSRWLTLCAERRATCTSAPPFAYDLARKRLQRSGARPDLRLLRLASCGAEPIDASILRRFSDDLVEGRAIFQPSYGMAEMVCVISLGLPGKPIDTRHVRRPFRIGHPIILTDPDDRSALELTGNGPALDSTRVRITGSEGEPLPDGVFGRIELRGTSMMDGYWSRPDATAAAFRETESGRWLRTGDLGFLSDGQIFIAGREKEVIILKGQHHFPEEIDQIITAVPGVPERGVITFGESDPSGGPERVLAVVERPGPPNESDEATLRRTIQQAVADHLGITLSHVCFTPRGTLPRTTSGKPRRAVARQRWGKPTGSAGDTP